MTDMWTGRRLAATAALLGLALLSGCMFAAGKFTSTLDLRKDGQFAFTYLGEIHVLALSDLATKNGSQSEFAPVPCNDLDDDGAQIERECTEEELAGQKDEWQQQQTRTEERRKREAEQMRSVMGGIDPEDPKAAEELAQRMRRQAGFRSVTYKGKGLYLVDFSISGKLTHGFSFPAIEGFPMGNAFVELALRNDGSVRFDAPGLVPNAMGNPAGAMMMGGLASEGAEGSGPKVPVPDGTVTLTTDGQILSNNTDEGPQASPDGQRLVWKVNARSRAAPMALLKLARP